MSPTAIAITPNIPANYHFSARKPSLSSITHKVYWASFAGKTQQYRTIFEEKNLNKKRSWMHCFSKMDVIVPLLIRVSGRQNVNISLVIFWARKSAFQRGLWLLGNKHQNQLRNKVKKKSFSLNHAACLSCSLTVSLHNTCVSQCYACNQNPLWMGFDHR